MAVTCYPTPGKAKSVKICEHFARGSGGVVAETSAKTLRPGPAFFYGWTDYTVPLMKQCQAEGREWYYADNAYYFGRGTYFRVTKNAFMHNGAGSAAVDRWQSFGIEIQPWRNNPDGHVIIATQSEAYYSMRLGIGREEWTQQVVQELRRHTKRRIVVCHKPDAKSSGNAAASTDFEGSLLGAWAVVIHSSSTGVKALIEGVPVISLGQSMCSDMGLKQLGGVENPHRPDDRYRWLCVLAANQWTYAELANGTAWRNLGGGSGGISPHPPMLGERFRKQ